LALDGHADAESPPGDFPGILVAMERPTGRKQLRTVARRAMLKRGLLPDFSPAVLAETDAIAKATLESGPSIRDLRGLLWASIDNDDSRDLDQITVAEPMEAAVVKILVAVADVDATVGRGSEVDGHARTNTTSVYTAGQTFPMLPEKLSTDLTSLGEDQDRMAIVTEVVVAPSGTVAHYEIYRALVRNRAKLAYPSTAAWLEGAASAPPRVESVARLDDNLRIQDRVAQAMKALRHRRGALGLDTLEARAVFDGEVLADLKPEEKNRSRELIEDFMIAANGAIAEYLDQKGLPALRRVLRPPERWERIVELAATLGERLPSEPNAPALAEFLVKRQVADADRFPDLSLSVVKLLGRGEYVLKMPGQPAAGHFGLAVSEYTHSTAPNRRFPDLITQRLLKAALRSAPAPYDSEELSVLAQHCTEQEDNAAKVERQVRKSAAALLLESRIGERFDAIVTGASPKGTWVRIPRPSVEGKLVHGFQGLDVGDRVRVELVLTDVDQGFIDFVRAKGS
jgi:VacB/RNase II family 3'-5' exoribonuclease